MIIFLLSVANTASDNLRLLLFILIIVAVALILTGGTIAMLSLVNQYKIRALHKEEAPND